MKKKIPSLWIEAMLLYYTHKADRMQRRLKLCMDHQRGPGKINRQFQSFLAAVRKQERWNVQLRRQTNKNILAVGKPIEDLEITLYAQSKLTQYDITVATVHHECGYWGDVPQSLWLQNNHNRLEGKGRVLSVYTTTAGERALVLSEDGQACLMMEEEYPCRNSQYPA